MGLVLNEPKPGDWVLVLVGGYTPFVLKTEECHALGSLDDRILWELVDELYIHGFMDGEALNG